ncbi:MAG: molecular chaperone DnaJ [Candidatus Hydrogenedentes bacterium]|nr:molecular chaperone DnaJ [Candidatus Hydrogenedentota bacterium]
MPRDYYDILGVSRDADEDSIRKTYRKLAHKYHPDKTGGDKAAEEKLKEINEAYGVLKNKEKRSHYDRFGTEGPQFGGGGGGFQSGSPFDDIFESFFGAGRGSRRGSSAAVAGEDLEYRTHITLREAAFGVKKKIRFNRMENCSGCSGSGAAKGSKREPCGQCGGVGQVRMSQGFFSVTRPCPRCSGSGYLIHDPCRRCRGQGRVETERELSVELPAGVDSGSRVRVTGEGEPGRNHGPRGDLYLYIEVEPDPVFTREGNDIICEIPLNFPQATLGATIRVPSLNGDAELKIPPGTQSGTVFKLRGLGVPDMRGYRTGNQLVRVQVETPTKLTKDQRALIEEFDGLSSKKTYPLHKRFMDRLRASRDD